MMNKIFGAYDFKGERFTICYNYEKQLNYIVVYSQKHGSFIRFRPREPLDIKIYSMIKATNTKLDALKVMDDESRHLIDYLKFVIEGSDGKIIAAKFLTFKELQDRVIADLI